MKTICAAKGCKSVCRPMYPFCNHHWKMLPRAMQFWVMGETRPKWGPEGPLPGYQAAVDTGVVLLSVQEGEPTTLESAMSFIDRKADDKRQNIGKNARVRAREMVKLMLAGSERMTKPEPKRREAYSVDAHTIGHLFDPPRERTSICGKAKLTPTSVKRELHEVCFACTSRAQIDDRRSGR